MSALPRIVFETGAGDFVIEADIRAAPITAGNFIDLVEDGAYDGGVFHRSVRLDNSANAQMDRSVIGRGMSGDASRYCLPDDRYPICVVQASAREGLGERSPILLERTRDTGLLHLEGSVAMSRQTPDSAVSDFFVCVREEPELDFGGRRNSDGQGTAVFGRVVEGMNALRRIHASPTRGQSLDPAIPVERAHLLA